MAVPTIRDLGEGSFYLYIYLLYLRVLFQLAQQFIYLLFFMIYYYFDLLYYVFLTIFNSELGGEKFQAFLSGFRL